MVSIPQTQTRRKRSLLQVGVDLRYWQIAADTACDHADTHYNSYIAPYAARDMDAPLHRTEENTALHETYLDCMARVQELKAERDSVLRPKPSPLAQVRKWLEEHPNMESEYQIGQQVPRHKFSKRERWSVCTDNGTMLWYLLDNGFVVAAGHKGMIMEALRKARVREKREQERAEAFGVCPVCKGAFEFCGCDVPHLEVI